MKRKRLTKKEHARITREAIVYQFHSANWFKFSTENPKSKYAIYWRQYYALVSRKYLFQLIGNGEHE